MGQANSTPGLAGDSNIFATGHTMYINEKGETITETIHHVNGETVRSTETGQMPTTGGGFMSTQSFMTAPWVAIALVATMFLVISTLMFALMMKQKLYKKNPKTRPIPIVEESLHSIPLYSINNPNSRHHVAGAKFNIDLLAEI